MRSASVRGMRLPRGRWALFAAVVALLAVAPAQARVNPKKAIWGPVAVNGELQFPLYQRLGVGIFQDYLPWREIATKRPAHPTDPSDPAYRWPATVDTAVREAKASGIKVSLLIQVTPSWANAGGPGSRAPKSSKDLADFVTAAAKRYPTVHLWMIWGEPSKAVNFD